MHEAAGGYAANQSSTPSRISGGCDPTYEGNGDEDLNCGKVHLFPQLIVYKGVEVGEDGAAVRAMASYSSGLTRHRHGLELSKR